MPQKEEVLEGRMLGFLSTHNAAPMPPGNGGSPGAPAGGNAAPEAAKDARTSGIDSFQSAFAKTAPARPSDREAAAFSELEDRTSQGESLGTPQIGGGRDDDGTPDPSTVDEVASDTEQNRAQEPDPSEAPDAMRSGAEIAHAVPLPVSATQSINAETGADRLSDLRPSPRTPAEMQAAIVPDLSHKTVRAAMVTEGAGLRNVANASPHLDSGNQIGDVTSDGDAADGGGGQDVGRSGLARGALSGITSANPGGQMAMIGAMGRTVPGSAAPEKSAEFAVGTLEIAPARVSSERPLTGVPLAHGAILAGVQPVSEQPRRDAPAPTVELSANPAPTTGAGQARAGAVSGAQTVAPFAPFTQTPVEQEGGANGPALHDLPLPGDARPVHISTTEPRGATPVGGTGPQMARHVAVQISDAVAKGADRSIDLILNPSELGRVRITLASGDGGMGVSVIAERPETLDLMRRHMDMLGQEFRDLGYGETTFTFLQERGTGQSPDTTQGAEPDPSGVASEPAPLGDGPAPTRGTPADRLDIRL